VGLFGWFSNEDKIPLAVADAKNAICVQVEAVRVKYSSRESLEQKLGDDEVVLFIHGFVNYYARRHRLRRPEFIWVTNVRAFEAAFGFSLGSRMILTLQKSLADSDALPWVKEGWNAAYYFAKRDLALLAAFLEGGAH
jgi:hypothetical protein